MKNFALKVQRFLVSEDGPTAVEYAVMLALIVIVCLTAIRSIGTNANHVHRVAEPPIDPRVWAKPYLT
jgi:pilus assembly protein Flp/PilA